MIQLVVAVVGYLQAESLGRSRHARQAEDAELETLTPKVDGGDRKMKQLQVLLQHYNGLDYDDSRIRGYGCNCFVSDFDMETPSYGAPVNNLDASCRAYQVKYLKFLTLDTIGSSKFSLR